MPISVIEAHLRLVGDHQRAGAGNDFRELRFWKRLTGWTRPDFTSGQGRKGRGVHVTAVIVRGPKAGEGE